MSEINFDEARNFLNDQIRQPSYDVIAANGRRRRTRNRYAVTGTAALALILATSGGMVTGQQSRDMPGAAVEIPKNPMLCFTEEVRANATVAVLRENDCEKRTGRVLATTVNNGETWEYRRVPDEQPKSRPKYDASIGFDGGAPIDYLGDETVVVGESMTTNWGKSWQPTPRRAGAPITTVPDHWKIFSIWRPNRETGAFALRKMPVSAIDPKTAIAHPLRNPPPADSGEFKRASDGSIWTARGGQESIVSVSHDRGRSWRKYTPTGIPRDSLLSVASGDGRIGYLAVAPISGGSASTLLRSSDGGRTWRRLNKTKIPQLTDIEVLPNGWLVGTDRKTPLGGPMLISRDYGMTFTTQNPKEFAIVARTAAGRYFMRGTRNVREDGRGEYFERVSVDGLSYRPLAIPPGAVYMF